MWDRIGNKEGRGPAGHPGCTSTTPKDETPTGQGVGQDIMLYNDGHTCERLCRWGCGGAGRGRQDEVSGTTLHTPYFLCSLMTC